MFLKSIKTNLLAFLAVGLMGFCSITANAQSDYYLSMPDVQANGGGTVTVPVSLNNATGIFSMQIEVFLPDGVDVISIDGTERVANAELFNYSEDKYTDDNQRYRRIIVANIQNMGESAISGNEGVLLNITFQLPEGEGVYPIQLKNLQFFNPPTYAITTMEDVTANITASDYYFSFPEIQANYDETIVVPLYLNNVDGIYSIQIDLMLADGVEFVDVTLGERVNAEFFQYGSEDKYTTDGLRYRRTVFANLANTASTISGNEGAVLYYTLKLPYHAQESYPIRVMNIQYFNPPTYALSYIADAEGTISVAPTTVLLGDVNHDGSIDVSDVTELINHILGTSTTCTICGDVVADETIDVSDVTALINIILNQV